MNAYLVDGGDYRSSYDTLRAIDVVFAETRGKARSIFLREYGQHFDWISPISIRLIARDVEREAGIADSKDEYWWAENWPFPDPYVVREDSNG